MTESNLTRLQALTAARDRVLVSGSLEPVVYAPNVAEGVHLFEGKVYLVRPARGRTIIPSFLVKYFSSLEYGPPLFCLTSPFRVPNLGQHDTVLVSVRQKKRKDGVSGSCIGIRSEIIRSIQETLAGYPLNVGVKYPIDVDGTIWWVRIIDAPWPSFAMTHRAGVLISSKMSPSVFDGPKTVESLLVVVTSVSSSDNQSLLLKDIEGKLKKSLVECQTPTGLGRLLIDRGGGLCSIYDDVNQGYHNISYSTIVVKAKGEDTRRAPSDMAYILRQDAEIVVRTRPGSFLSYDFTSLRKVTLKLDNHTQRNNDIFLLEDLLPRFQKMVAPFTADQVIITTSCPCLPSAAILGSDSTSFVSVTIKSSDPPIPPGNGYHFNPDTEITFVKGDRADVVVSSEASLPAIKVYVEIGSVTPFTSSEIPTEVFLDKKDVDHCVRLTFTHSSAAGSRSDVPIPTVSAHYVATILRVITSDQRCHDAEDPLPQQLFHLTPDTEILYLLAADLKGHRIISEEEEIPREETPEERFERVVRTEFRGYDKELDKIKEQVIYPRSLYRKEYAKRNLLPEKGIIIAGPPGTGKTSLAKAIINVLQIKTENVKAVRIDEIFHKNVGESEKRVNKLFQKARQEWEIKGERSDLHAIFIDEIETALGKRVGDWRDGLVSQFLTEMEGFRALHNVICIGTTNRIDSVDPAIMRSGRFGLIVRLELPTPQETSIILQHYLEQLRRTECLVEISQEQIDSLAGSLAGRSGADIRDAVTKASSASINRFIKTGTDGKVTYDDLLQSISKTCQSTRVEHMSMYN